MFIWAFNTPEEHAHVWLHVLPAEIWHTTYQEICPAPRQQNWGKGAWGCSVQGAKNPNVFPEELWQNIGYGFITRTGRQKRGKERGWKHFSSAHSFKQRSLPLFSAFSEHSCHEDPGHTCVYLDTYSYWMQSVFRAQSPSRVHNDPKEHTHLSTYRHFQVADRAGWTWMCQWVICKLILGTDVGLSPLKCFYYSSIEQRWLLWIQSIWPQEYCMSFCTMAQLQLEEEEGKSSLAPKTLCFSSYITLPQSRRWIV